MVPAIIFDKIREMRFVFMSIKNFFIGSTDKKNARSEPKFKGYTVQFNIPITAKAIEDIFTDCYDFEARKVIAPRPDLNDSACDVLETPVVVCRASGTCVVPLDKQRKGGSL